MVISDMYYQYDTYFRRPPPFSLESRPVLGLSAFRLSAGSQNNQFLALSAPSTLRFLNFRTRFQHSCTPSWVHDFRMAVVSVSIWRPLSAEVAKKSREKGSGKS